MDKNFNNNYMNMTLEDAQLIIQKAVDAIQMGGFTLLEYVEAQGNIGVARTKVVGMTVQDHKAYLASITPKPPIVDQSKPTKK